MIIGEGNYTEIVSGEEVKEKLLRGASAIKTAVGTTFGPHGSNVALCKFYNPPHVTKDGVTVAHDLRLADHVEDVALQIIKQAAKQTAKKAGDGTTSTTVLAATLVEKGLSSLKGVTIRDIQNNFSAITKEVIEKVTENATPVNGEEDIYNVAYVASNGDSSISELITEAFGQQDTNKVIVRDSDTGATRITVVDGIRMDSTSMLQLDEKRVFDDVSILVTDLDIVGVQGASKILRLYADLGETPIIVIANDIDAEASKTLNYARSKGAKLDAIRPPHIADARREYSRLLAKATGAVFFDSKKGFQLKEVRVDQLGKADSVVIDFQETAIIGRYGEVTTEVASIKEKIEGNKDQLSDLYKGQLAILQGKTAVLEVGGNNEVEVRELKDRIDDTVRAVEASIKTGTVKGALLAYSFKLEGDYHPEILNLVTSSLQDMRDQLLVNNNGEEIWNESVMDPALVATEVFKNALSSAALILTTQCVIVKKNHE